MKKIHKWTLICLLCSTSCLVGANGVVHHFDSKQEVKSCKTPAQVEFRTDKKLAGKGSAALICNLDSKAWRIDLPSTKANEGVATFWIYDPLLDQRTMDRGFTVYCKKMIDSKGKNKNFSISNGRNNLFWMLNNSFGVRERDLAIPRHMGWTRFDIVNPKGKGDQKFKIYIDGRLAGESVEKYSRMWAIVPRTFWGYGDIYIDELSYGESFDAFKPSAIQDIRIKSENEDGVISLLTGKELELDIILSQNALKATKGSLILELLDGAENPISKKDVAIKHNKINQNGSYSLKFPAPPHSGIYWLKAKYNDGSNLVYLKKLNIQFYQKGYDSSKNTITLAAAWDWLPYGKRAPYRKNIATPKNAPQTPPTDWSSAIKIKGMWNKAFDKTYQSGWYQRKIKLPAVWKGKKIFLDIDDPLTIATVYINRKKIGEIEWPGGRIDVSKYVCAGDDVMLSVFVRAEIIVGYHKVLREIIGPKYNPTNTIFNRGLRGKVQLLAVPNNAIIDRVAIATTVTTSLQKIKVKYYLSNLKNGKKYTLESNVSVADKTALKLPGKTFVAKGKTQVIELKKGWNKPELWDFAKPFLYDLNARIIAGDRVIDIMQPERFGFREIKFEGKYVKLNGRVINLFHSLPIVNYNNFGLMKWLRKFGFNYLSGTHLNHMVVLGNGKRPLYKLTDYLAGAGIGTHIRLGWFSTKTLSMYGKENDPRYWKFFNKILDYTVRHYGNNPSVFFWGAVGARLDMGAMYNPYLQDGLWIRDNSGNKLLNNLEKAENRVKKMLHKADPTRQVIAQDSGNFQDSCNITQYCGFMPIQEMIQMNQYWCRNGTKPFFYSEQAAPYSANWSSFPRDRGHGTKKIIPYIAEWCAVTKGDKAFIRTKVDQQYLKEYEGRAKAKFSRIYKIKDSNKRKNALNNFSNNYGPASPQVLYELSPDNLRNEVWIDRLREQILNFRLDGIGLLCASYNGSLGYKMYECFNKCQAPVTGFISGPDANRYDKTHIFAPGESLKRNITIFNNSKKNKQVKYDWSVKLDGKIVESNKGTVEVPPGKYVQVPVEVLLNTDQDCSGALTLKLYEIDKSGESTFLVDDKYDLNVICATVATDFQANIVLIDPQGDTAKILRKAGITFQQVPFNYKLDRFDIVIIGRKAFEYEKVASSDGINLGKLMQVGKKVIIFEQSEKTLRDRFKFRTEYSSPRNVYARNFGGTLFNGLPNGCLKYWRGEATLTNAYEVARQNLKPVMNEGNGGRWFYKWNNGKKHPRPMKWGNLHNVATVVVIKPDTGNFTTLADCEFALNYAAVWQLQYDNGYIVFNQLDVSGRSETGPELKKYVQNLIAYVEKLPKTQWKKVFYLGDKKGAELLDFIRVPYETVSSPAAVKDVGAVLIVGDCKVKTLLRWKMFLSKFVSNGGTVFSLPKDGLTLAVGWTPFKISANKKPCNSTLIGQTKDPLLAGLGNADFFWKGSINIWSLAKINGADLQFDSGILARVPQGKGQWIFCQIEPEMLKHKDYFWLNDSERYTERTLRTMLSNLNIKMMSPKLLDPSDSSLKKMFSMDLSGKWHLAIGSGDTANIKTCKGVKSWRSIKLPGNYRVKGSKWDAIKGSLWYRRSFVLSEDAFICSDAKLFIGAVEGEDHVFVNGKEIGSTTSITNPNDLSSTNREYSVPLKLLKKGKNEIAIFTVFNTINQLCPGDGNITPPMILNFYRRPASSVNLEPIALNGWWRGIAVNSKCALPAALDKNWHKIKVPGVFEYQHGHWASHDGYFWYKREFVIPENLPSGATPFLIMNAVDDEDETYINGKLIGQTNKQTNPKNYWCAKRIYPVSTDLLKTGKNIITVRVRDIKGHGGIIKPVTLIFNDQQTAKQSKLGKSPYLHMLTKLDDPYMFQGW